MTLLESAWSRDMQMKLLKWFEVYQRPLPWRGSNPNPYQVLVSENMLQQTRVASAQPYYRRFIRRFPTIKSLAEASEADVLGYWAGLGYYSRARNLRKAAQQIHKLGRFPETYSELITLPGLGPYSARAISSIAFKESVGVLDGNVIRILSRLYDLEIPWWKSAERAILQDLADKAVQGVDSSRMNQAMMELGSTLCISKSPACLICPILDECQSQKRGYHLSLPLKRPRKEREIWVWKPTLYKRRDEIGFVKNDYAPFLKGQLFLPGSAHKGRKKPPHYDFRHSITHHDIYVQLPRSIEQQGKRSHKEIKYRKKSADMDIRWVKSHEVHQQVPSSLIQKTLKSYLHNS